MDTIFISGGAGFIGSRLVERLASRPDKIVVFDNLHPQVHPRQIEPSMPANGSFVRGDVRDRIALETAITAAQPGTVFHLAAETGTAQSHDSVSRYCDVNVMGTAHLLEALRQTGSTRRVILAGSRAVYGEGPCRDKAGRLVSPEPRAGQAVRGDFSLKDASGEQLQPVPTSEDFPPAPVSIYGATKLMQEHLLAQGLARTGVETVILRLQNVYGPGQSMTNPYTGVLSIFSSQILAGRELTIFEDGEIVRDFVFVDDAVDALLAAATVPDPGAKPINIGSGKPTTILEAARLLLQYLKAPADRLRISGQYRQGDIRHAVADIARAQAQLGWQPTTGLDEGLAALTAWARQQYAAGR